MLIELGFGAMGEFNRTGRRGPVGGSEHVPCLPAMVAVPRACTGTHETTRRAEERWAARNGVAPPFLSPVGCNGVSAAARHAGAGGQGRHRRREDAKRACGMLQTGGRGGEERAKGTVGM